MYVINTYLNELLKDPQLALATVMSFCKGSHKQAQFRERSPNAEQSRIPEVSTRAALSGCRTGDLWSDIWPEMGVKTSKTTICA